jgi:hypothetical protein
MCLTGIHLTLPKLDPMGNRLLALWLPTVDGIGDGLTNYTKTAESAGELVTDVVYELCGLTNAETESGEDVVKRVNGLLDCGYLTQSNNPLYVS